MVGSTSFSSGARISVIPSIAIQSIAAPCIGCQKDSFWNGRHRGDFTHHGQDHSVDVARGIPTGYSSTVRGSTVQWPLFTFFHIFGALVLTIPVFSLEPECSYCAHVYYSQQLVPVQIFLTSSGCFLCRMVLYRATSDSPATGGLSSIPPLLLQPYEYYVLYCCTALLSLPLLLRSILLQVLLLFPLCCCIASATASLSPSVPEQLPPARKCQQHEMHPPRNRRMINMYRRV
jgi:hypothetical protein